MRKRPQRDTISGGGQRTSAAEAIVATICYILDEQGYTKVHYNLHCSEDGEFSLTEATMIMSASGGYEVDSAGTYRLSYDQALAFVRGEEIKVQDRMIGSMEVELLDPTVFPPVPEATGEEHR